MMLSSLIKVVAAMDILTSRLDFGGSLGSLFSSSLNPPAPCCWTRIDEAGSTRHSGPVYVGLDPKTPWKDT